MTDNKKQKKISLLSKGLEEDIRRLVMERIKASSEDLGISVGSKKGYTKAKLLESVELGDELGREIIKTQMKYLKDLAAGRIYQGE